jgi:hypothetical protein
MKLAVAHATQHSPVYIAGDGARFTIRHDGKPAIEVRFDDALPDLHHLARQWDESGAGAAADASAARQPKS